jgi:hypothetical protein
MVRPQTVEELLALLTPWLKRQSRPAWTPVLKRGDGPVTCSKYGGLPWLARGESWPECTSCGRPLSLFLQLDLDALPAELERRFGRGLLQLFYCPEAGGDDCFEDDGWEPFSGKAQRVRIVHPGRETSVPKKPAGLAALPAKRIAGWKAAEDWPRWQELEELGLTSHYDFDAKRVQVRCRPLKLVSAKFPMESLAVDSAVADAGFDCIGEDKLAGWPCWIQGVEYPACPRCGSRMRPLYQLTGDPLRFMFGDAGIGHVTQCARHRDVVAFGWACH